MIKQGIRNEEKLFDDIVSLCKRRGFVFQSSEIYGGFSGVYDYGPLGAMLKRNIEKSWLKKFVETRDDMYQLDSSILMHGNVWKASGHAEGFADSIVECSECNTKWKIDSILESQELVKGAYMCPNESCDEPLGSVDDIKKRANSFNLMLATKVGAFDESSLETYLRPETAQGIFINFKNILDSMHPKMPFGVAQIGKAFRNEITPRNFLFRVREFDQMEIEYFVEPKRADEYFEYWRAEIMEWLVSLGIDMNKVSEYETPKDDLAHYSDRTIDFQFEYPFGCDNKTGEYPKRELCGLANRTDHDLIKHGKASGISMEYMDPITNEKYVPYIIEPSIGIGRIILALLCSVYHEEITSSIDDGEEKRVYLKLPLTLAPYIVAVSPLLKNKPELVEKARHVYRTLKDAFGNVTWDDNGNIGKRYRRQDEIGTPFCVVVDFDSLDKKTVTIRHRDTMKQDIVMIDDVTKYIASQIGG
ncbi:glycine--tRNA ligase [Candidatus Nomurabacteria bacterium RIFCSPLOWO2_01_FULL_36_10b]|uniref:glycine--tRNA ligase n=1 Tax=Candidatus Nomurabacteria bacterium RIFCSPLOWO2_01_FULL_36_10b TaxID=1801766 RepID=A0A1F6WQL2_9BACT|nr:MAG: glycine--tRNA ligase [Candidatus Nomurabacteria bacterium RIFCSPLOWO2_01_FULL_36_10b]